MSNEQASEVRENEAGMSKATENRLRILQRVECANAFIKAIAGRGRNFFSHEGRVAFIERDAKGGFWFHNAWNQQRVYVSNRLGKWRGFHHGGTLRALVTGLVKYIREGGPVWMCEGFGWQWGYEPPDILAVINEGQRLSIIARPERNYAAEMKLPDGKTCESCRHINRCVGLGYSWPARTSCDFHPNRFQEKAVQNA